MSILSAVNTVNAVKNAAALRRRGNQVRQLRTRGGLDSIDSIDGIDGIDCGRC